MRRALWAVVVIVAAVLLVTVPGCQSGSKPAIAEAVLQVTPPLLSESITVVNRVRFEDQVQQNLTTAQLQDIVDTFHLYEGLDRVEQLRTDLSILVKDHQVIVRYRHRDSDRVPVLLRHYVRCIRSVLTLRRWLLRELGWRVDGQLSV